MDKLATHAVVKGENRLCSALQGNKYFINQRMLFFTTELLVHIKEAYRYHKQKTKSN
jgi:hypothetical protein